MTEQGIRVELYNSAGTKLDAGPVIGVLSAQYSQALGQIGSFSFSIPADDDKASIVTNGNEARIYVGGEGLVFRGLIDKAETQIQQDGSLVLTASGFSISRKLVWENTEIGRTFDSVTLSSAVTTLLTGTAFSAGTLDVPSTNFVGRFDGVSIWEALAAVAEKFHLYLREDVINAEIDISAFGTNPNSIVFRNVDAMSPLMSENTKLYAIRDLKILAESSDVWNSIIPLGQRQGISGENLTLENSDRSSPYTIQTKTGPDSATEWYIEDSTSVTAYGRRKRVVQFKDEVPLGLTATDFTRAANALYDRAVTFLQRHKDPISSYAVSVVGLKHLISGSPVFQVGDVIKVQFAGVTQDVFGKRAWKSVDSNLYVMGYTRRFDSSGMDDWQFVVSNVAQEIPNDGSVAAEFISKIHAVEAAPLPFVLFGDNLMRIDPNGVQIAAPAAELGTIWWLDDLAPDPTAVTPYVKAAGRSDPTGGFGGDTLASLRLESYRQTGSWSRLRLTQAVGSDYNTILMEVLNSQSSDSDTPAALELFYGDAATKQGVAIRGGPLRLANLTADPDTTFFADGNIWYRSDLDKFQAIVNGAIVDLGGGGSSWGGLTL